MSLYVDPSFSLFPLTSRSPFSRVGRAAHLSADALEELRAYLAHWDFPRSYLHYPRSYRFHYDLYGRYLAFVLADPCIRKLTRRDYIRKLQEKRRRHFSLIK